MIRMIFISLLVALVVNVIVIDYYLFRQTAQEKTSLQINEKANKLSSPSLTINNEAIDIQADQFVDFFEVIKSATDSLTLKVDELISKPSPKTQPLTKTTVTQTVKELYIPLGSGATNVTSWIDLPGVEAYVVPQNYGSISQMYFEAALRIPTGNGRAYARLINVTDNTSIFESEVSYEGSSGKLISSGNIPPQKSTKLYRVQLKSSLGAEVVLDNARIKLFTP